MLALLIALLCAVLADGVLLYLLLKKPAPEFPSIPSIPNPVSVDLSRVEALLTHISKILEPPVSEGVAPLPATHPVATGVLPGVKILRQQPGGWVEIGHRPIGHPDVNEALRTPGLAVERDGSFDPGVQYGE